MRFKIRPQLPGAGRTRVGHHHGSHTPTSPEAILPHQTNPPGVYCFHKSNNVHCGKAIIACTHETSELANYSTRHGNQASLTKSL